MFKRTHFVCFSAFLLFAIPSISSAESMKNAVHHAVTTNPDGLADGQVVETRRQELLELRSQYLPSFSAFGELGGQVIDNPNVLSQQDNGDLLLSRQVGVQGEVLIFDGFRRSNSIYLNATRLDESIYRLLATSETLALNAVEVYIDVVRHRNLLHISRKNVQRHQQIANQVRARVSGGKAPISDNFQVQERVLAAQDALAEVELALRDAEDRYRRVIGHAPRGKMKIAHVRAPASKAWLVENSVKTNFSIAAAEKLINANEYERRINKADKLPRVTLNGNTSVGGDRSGSRGREYDAFLGLRMSWSLYSGGARKRRDSALEARVAEAGFRRDSLSREVRELAARSWNRFSVNTKRSRLISAQVSSNRRIVRNYIEEFELGKRSLLDVLDAELSRFNSEFERTNVNAAISFSKFQMLATQSKLAAHFGIASTDVTTEPAFEHKTLRSPRSIFNIKIDPLR